MNIDKLVDVIKDELRPFPSRITIVLSPGDAEALVEDHKERKLEAADDLERLVKMIEMARKMNIAPIYEGLEEIYENKTGNRYKWWNKQ